ncbi:MAG: glutaredoxin [Ignavibacteriae bacterium]|nr:glutaredoxin [Ignavibacteriota bacterium]NOG99774.1 glutaredoxin [Ignavibacteriota bacterium]
MIIEVFTAGCKFCGDVELQVTEIAGDKHKVIVYNTTDKNYSTKYYEAAKNYGINSLPSVVVKGELLTCCSRKNFNPELLTQALR